MRARMALYHARVQCEVREVLLKDKPADMLAISPKATVPVLQLPDGRVIDESLDIMRWALVEDDAWLPADAAKMFDLIAYNDGDFKRHLDRYKYPQRFDAEIGTGVEKGDGVEHFHKACVFLQQLDARLAQSQFLFGNAVSLADVAIFPFVRQFAAVDQQAFLAFPVPHVQQWLSCWLADEGFQRMMLKRCAWQSNDEAVFLF